MKHKRGHQVSESSPSFLELGLLELEVAWASSEGGFIIIFVFIFLLADTIMFSFLLRDAIYIAPSGVQKERIKSEDLFVQDIKGQDLKVPSKALKKSQCTPLFMCAYTGN